MDCLQDAPARPHWLFTSETARLNAKKGVELRKQKAVEAEALQAKPVQPESDASANNPLAAKLARVQDELVNQMQGNKDAAEVSKLSRALKDVREVYHLVTGQAKPGVIRETGRSSRRQTSKPAPLPDEDTPQAPATPDPGNA